MANTFLNYTGLTYDDIKADIMSRLSEDSRFSNFRESALYSVITEIFTATTDFTNYYMERRAEESFLDSAQLRSSVVLLSKMLGYVITRPIPASTSFKIRIKSLPPLATVDKQLSIPAGATFSYNGVNFILPKGLVYTLTSADIINFNNDPQYYKELSYRAEDVVNDGRVFDDSDSRSTTPIKLIQGETRVKTFEASTNSQMGKRYQTYTIDDPTFANLYGDQDVGYSITNPELSDITSNWTRVAIGTSENDAFCINKDEFDAKSEFWIDRRSFLNNNTIPLLSATGAGATVKYCVIRTNMTDGVELLFGDDNVSRVGAKTNHNVYVRYISTLGAQANTVGVIGKLVQCSLSQYGENGFDQKNVEFYLTSNITGGSDIESMDSIKINSPEIFYSLERCVTPRDYISYLKTLVLTTKSVKNAIAWGEQEETRNVAGLANIKLFNVVLFSVLSDMYSKLNDSVLGEIYTGLDTDANILVAPTSATDHDWFKVMMLSDSTTPLKNVQADNSPEMKDLKRVYDNLYNRSQLTVKNVYVAPIIQDFYLSGTIYFNPLIDKNLSTKKINNAVYTHLSMNADFNTPIYISTIVDLIEDFPEVHHADVYFIPKDTEDDMFSRRTPGAGTPSISAGFNNVPVDYVYSTSWTNKEKFGTREYSRNPVDQAIDIQKMIIASDPVCKEISAFKPESYESIFCLLPEFEVKSTKIDTEYVESKLIWPSSNSYDQTMCGLVTTDTTNAFNNYYPSERNLYLGLMKCYLDKLNVLAQKDQEALSTIIEKWDAILSSTKCICSLKEKNMNDIAINTTAQCKANVLGSDVSDIRKYISEYFYYYVKLLRNTFLYDIRLNMIDTSGNITNFSMRNEIARVDLTNLKYSYT